jgi:hypothetical protein
MEACLKELTLLRDLSEEIVKGRDPNLSVLLGARDASLLLHVSVEIDRTDAQGERCQ